MQEKVSFRNSRGQKLVGVLHKPKSVQERIPLVIFAHGKGSGKKSEKALELSKRLPKEGTAFLRFDFSGCGESEGRFEDATISDRNEDLKAAFQFISNLDYVDKERIGIIGSSLGGMVVTLALSEGMETKTTVLISPAVDYGEYHREVTPESRMSDEFYADVRKRDFFELARSIRCPCLVIHGDKDDVCFLSGSQKLMESLPEGSKLEVIEGEGHFYTDPDNFEKMITLTVEWFKKTL